VDDISLHVNWLSLGHGTITDKCH